MTKQPLCHKLIANRVLRKLTAYETERLEQARKEAAEAKQAIISEAKLRQAALKAVAQELDALLKSIKARREELGLSSADVEARTGIKCSALSRLENSSKDANPTLLTLQRCALALGMAVHVSAGPS